MSPGIPGPRTPGQRTPDQGPRTTDMWSEVWIRSEAHAALFEGLLKHADPAPRFGEIGVVQIDVEEIDVPRQLVLAGHIGLDDLPRNRQSGGLRPVVHVPVAGVE